MEQPQITELKVRDKLLFLVTAFLSAFKPPEVLTITQWSDKNRVLPDYAPEPGPYRSSRTPYLREIGDLLSPNSIYDQVIAMKGSQLGFTEKAMNMIFYYAKHEPCPIMYVQPTIETVEDWSKEKLETSVEACESMHDVLYSEKEKDKKNTIRKKKFPGGSLTLSGANSSKTLRSKSIRVLIMDEIDDYPASVGLGGNQGSPIKLAIKRTTNYARRKIYYLSTPTVKDFSNIEREFKDSDQRYYNIPCPFCGQLQVITWPKIIFKDPETKKQIKPYMQCEHCHEKIHEHYKTEMLEKGVWIATNPKNPRSGFHLSGLYSPLGWYSWDDAVKEFLDAVGDPELMKVFVNTVLAETFDASIETVNHHWLMRRTEPYLKVPAKAVCLVAGVDTQDNRLECTIFGVGAGEETWVYDHQVFYGIPDQPTVWGLLDAYLNKDFENENGLKLNIACTAVDSGGHYTDDVYRYCLARQWRNVWAIRGGSHPGTPFIGMPSNRNRVGCFLFTINVDIGKDILYGRLINSKYDKDKKINPGYIHFPKRLKEQYFKQLTSEKKILRYHLGAPYHAWERKKGLRAEALDCFNYAQVAFKILNLDVDNLAEKNLVYRLDAVAAPGRRRRRRVVSKGFQT